MLSEGAGPEDLEGEQVLLTEAGCSYRNMFERVLSEAGTVSIQPRTLWRLRA